jgi:hypothetical protein
VNPNCRIGFIVVGNPAIGVITLVPLGKLNPFLDVIANIISRLALEPLLVNTPYVLLNNLGKLVSNFIPSAPKTNQPPNNVFTAAVYSSDVKYGPAY